MDKMKPTQNDLISWTTNMLQDDIINRLGGIEDDPKLLIDIESIIEEHLTTLKNNLEKL